MAVDRNDNRNRDLPAWARLLTLEAGADLDSLSGPGIYAAEVPINGPLDDVDMFVTVLSQNVGGVHRMVQIVNETENGRSYTRVRKDTGWSAWNWDNPLTQTEVLQGALTLYVRTDGSDLNTGLANTAAGALRTISQAVTLLNAYNLNRQPVTIKLGTTGNWSSDSINIPDLTNPNTSIAGFSVKIEGASEGNLANSRNYVLPSTVVLSASNPEARYVLSGVSLGSVNGSGARIRCGSCSFSGVYGGYIGAGGQLTFDGCEHRPTSPSGCLWYMKAENATMLVVNNQVLVGTPAYVQGVFSLAGNDVTPTKLIFTSGTFTGAATGKQYYREGKNTHIYADTGFSIGTPADSTFYAAIPGDAVPAALPAINDCVVVSGVIQGTLSDRTYPLILQANWPFRIRSVSANLIAGTATGQLKINSTNTGSALALATGALAPFTNAPNKVTPKDPALNIELTSTAGASDLQWVAVLEPVFKIAGT